MSWLDRVFFRGLVSVQTAGTALPAETTLNFTGAGVVVTDDPVNGRTNVAIAGGGGGATLPVTDTLVVKTSNYTIVASTDYHVEVGPIAAGITITLPASPSTGNKFVVTNNGSSAITVSGGANTINATSATSMTLARFQSVTFVWSSTSSMWLAA